MKLIDQYRDSNEIVKFIPTVLDKAFLRSFVDEYRVLVQASRLGGVSFFEEPKILKFYFEPYNSKDNQDDFDLLFLAYLTLFKFDFPNIQIEFHYPEGKLTPVEEQYFYKLNQHRIHLEINAKHEIFKLFFGKKLYKTFDIDRSGTYLPPLIINSGTVKILFKRRTVERGCLKLIQDVMADPRVRSVVRTKRQPFFAEFNKAYNRLCGDVNSWQLNDLSGLYLIRALDDLFILRHIVNVHEGKKSSYQIGQTIKEASGDQHPADFRDKVLSVLIENGVFLFSDVECYFFSILIENGQIFKVPTDKDEMENMVGPFYSAAEIKAFSASALKKAYINLYVENLGRIIEYAKGFAYTLHELAKNMAEHTSSGKGVITARIFSFDRIRSLKSPDQEWLNHYGASHKFLDINAIDSGAIGIRDSYLRNLIAEKGHLVRSIKPENLKEVIISNYDDDIRKLGSYKLADFLNFRSIKLYHQINRVKARLGLLIFSQYILRERGALIQLSSQNLDQNFQVGYNLFVSGEDVKEVQTDSVYSLGTCYNFLVPIGEQFEHKQKQTEYKNAETSISSSVFLELQDYGHNSGSKVRLRTIDFKTAPVYHDKYEKLESLRAFIGPIQDNEILVVNAESLTHLLLNSSDWVRFLANVQFGYDHAQDIVIWNMPVELYEEIVQILKIFDTKGKTEIGFWRKNCQILFFLPIFSNGGRFWFNSLLTSNEYAKFIKLNLEIDLYHLNLIRISEGYESVLPIRSVSDEISSKLFSASNKLLNLELLIVNENFVSLFEDTISSFINLEIQDPLNKADEGLKRANTLRISQSANEN